MKYAFTGTKTPGPYDGRTIMRVMLQELNVNDTAITGACIGVDARVARIARLMGNDVHTIVPSDISRVDPNWKIWTTSFEELLPGAKEPYRERNTAMVQQCDKLIGFPMYAESHPASKFSGTWMTIRIARKMSKPVDFYILSEEVQ